MDEIKAKIKDTDWQAVADAMDDRGYAIVPGFLSSQQCRHLIDGFDDTDAFRKTVDMARYRFGLGSYKYWAYPLPGLVQALRIGLYPKLAPIANRWMERLNIPDRFPDTFEGLQAACHGNGQEKPTPLILSYGPGGYNTLHQDLYGDVYFPMQAACFLSAPDTDYSGGAFVLTEQVPRTQSKAIVLKPDLGDMLIFTTRFRPVKGTRGYYRVNMKHGVSEVAHGERYTLGIIFHDATS